MSRLAIVSDVHGNLVALEAVADDLRRRGVDRVVHAGDLAFSGAQPAEVVDRIRELGWSGIVGNTDEMLWRPERHAELEARAPKLDAMLRVFFAEYAPATAERLGDERIAWLRELPDELRIDDVVLVHASPGDLWRAPMADASEEDLASVYGESGAPVAVYGHIHVPFVRSAGAMTVANSGAVGSPFDGDPRASYLLVEDAAPTVIRVPYDLDREIAALRGSGYPDAERIAETRRTGRFVWPR
jgi:putative phosphoesterase